MLTQQKLGSVTSESSDLSLVLFDEIEKAAPSLTRLLMGVLDKALLRLGDNTTVNFERALIFLTSNLGAREMHSHLKPGFGFEALAADASGISLHKLHHIGMGARHRGQPVVMLIADRDIRVLTPNGEPLRHLTLDPTRDYQPQT